MLAVRREELVFKSKVRVYKTWLLLLCFSSEECEFLVTSNLSHLLWKGGGAHQGLAKDIKILNFLNRLVGSEIFQRKFFFQRFEYFVIVHIWAFLSEKCSKHGKISSKWLWNVTKRLKYVLKCYFRSILPLQ